MIEFNFEKYIHLVSKKISKKWHLETHLEDIHQTVWVEYLAKKDKFKNDHYRLRMECWNVARDYCIEEIYGSRGNHHVRTSTLLKRNQLSFVPLTYLVGACIIDERAENRELLNKVKCECEHKDKNKKIKKYTTILNVLMENANGESRTYLCDDEHMGLSKATFSWRVKELRSMLNKNQLCYQ